MHAIVIEAPRNLVIKEMDRPQAGPGEVLVRITAAGICGTDLHLYEGGFGEFPMIPGHDVAGVIEAVGEGVDPDRIGQRVTVDPAACCLRSAVPMELCPACQKGDTHLCRHATYLGMTAPGAMAEFITTAGPLAVPLEDAISDEAATVLEPVVVGLHLQEKIVDRPGDVLIIGGGPIGVVAGLILQDEGREVVVSEPLENRRRMAHEMGVARILTPEQVPVEMPVAVIVETSGHPSASDTMIKAAVKGATIVLVGGATDIPGIVILSRELEVRAAKGGRGLYPQAVALVGGGRLPVERLISHRFAARDAARAFHVNLTRRREVTRAVLDLTRW